MNFDEPKNANQSRPEDRWLDEALAYYSNAEPRPGLENRLLANLEAHAAERRRRWFYAFAAAAAVVLFAVLITTIRTVEKNPTPIATNKNLPAPTVQATKTEDLTATSRKSGVQLVRRRSASGHKTVNSGGTVLLADVKQERFPADQPLSEQEKLLQMYLKQTPQQELQLIAGRQQSAAEINIPELDIQPIEIDKSTAQ